MKRVYVPYNVAASHLQSADVLSYRLSPIQWNPLTWLGWALCKMIAIAGRSDDVHTAAVDFNTDQRLIALGMRLGSQKLLFLEDEVGDNPGLIDVYRYVHGHTGDTGALRPYEARSLPLKVRRAICDTMRYFALKNRYGWLAVLRSSLYFVVGLRLLAPHFKELDADSTDKPARPFCSQAVSHAIRKWAAPLLNNRPDRMMLPGDVITSTRIVYLLTLVPADETPGDLDHYYERAAA